MIVITKTSLRKWQNSHPKCHQARAGCIESGRSSSRREEQQQQQQQSPSPPLPPSPPPSPSPSPSSESSPSPSPSSSESSEQLVNEQLGSQPVASRIPRMGPRKVKNGYRPSTNHRVARHSCPQVLKTWSRKNQRSRSS